MYQGQFKHRVKRNSVHQPGFLSDRIVGRCRQRVAESSVDVDNSDPDVIIVDVVKASSHATTNKRRNRNGVPCRVINLDDEDEDTCRRPNVPCFQHIPSTSLAGSKQSKSPYCQNCPSTSAESSNQPRFNLFRKRYGVGAENQSMRSAYSNTSPVELYSSESDASDCEMEDVSGNIREQWQRAASRKRPAANLSKSTSTSESTCEDEMELDGEQNNYNDESGLNVMHEAHSDKLATERNNSNHNAENSHGGMPCAGSHVEACALNTECDDIGLHQEPSTFVGHGASSSQMENRSQKNAEGETNLERNGSTRNNVENVIGQEAAGAERNGCMTRQQRSLSETSDESSISEPLRDAPAEDETCDSFEANVQHNNANDPHMAVTAVDISLGVGSTVDQSELICAREKHKETSEYQRAAEEEWASRQRQLQIQAEEVQKLRRIRKEERRLLDVEKRQKERVEEIREAQRKNEETSTLKEKIRDLVRKELDTMEKKYRDMASLLRALKVEVGGGLMPSSNEIRAAFKRALLMFHPDRVSSSDITQQVKAEETFKFISRLKDKLLPAAK